LRIDDEQDNKFDHLPLTECEFPVKKKDLGMNDATNSLAVYTWAHRRLFMKEQEAGGSNFTA
jgi:hypothetical protein